MRVVLIFCVLWGGLLGNGCRYEIEAPSLPTGSMQTVSDASTPADTSVPVDVQTPVPTARADAACTQAQSCDGVCCSSNARCVQDGAGNRFCANRCQTNRDCPGTCCAVVDNAATSGPFSGGVCVVVAPECRCESWRDCPSQVCAPRADQTGNPIGPYICGKESCLPYEGCSDSSRLCLPGYCYTCDVQGNCFCAKACTDDSMCGGGECKIIGLGPRNQCDLYQPVCMPRS